MPLKLILDSLEEVPEELHSLYEEKDGKFQLLIDDAVPKAKLNEFRASNIALKKELDELKQVSEKFKGIDLEEYKQLKAEQEKSKERQLLDEGKVEELLAERVKKMQEAHTKELQAVKSANEALKANNEQLTKTLNRELITNHLQAAATGAKLRKEAIPDAVMFGERVFRLQDGKVVAVGDDDNPLYDKDGEPLTIQGWFEERRGDRPHWFEASSGGGASGNQNGAGGGNNGRQSSKPLGQMTNAEKAKLIREVGYDKFTEMVKEANSAA